MSRVAILTPALVAGDAVSNDVVGMADALKARGHEVGLFAEDIVMAGTGAKPASKAEKFLRHDHSILIYHFSVGWSRGLSMLKNTQAKRVVKYHNVTPPRFFDGVSADYASVCRAGREQLREVARAGCDLYLSDSDYNRRELIAECAPEQRSATLPPFHHIDRLRRIEADLAVLDRYRNGTTNILMVGRVAPNKRHDNLISAFAAYYHCYNRRSRLFIVGKEDERLMSYSNRLRAMARRLGVAEAVSFVGGVSDAELKAYYLVADVFMITSEHEGFCVPLVEAMAMKIPVIAYGSSAIPGTLGNAGIVWDEMDADLLASSVNILAGDKTVSQKLGWQGWRRYGERFTNEKIEKEFLKALQPLL